MKHLGAALLLVACAAIGIIRVQSLKKRRETLSMLAGSLQLIRNELSTRLVTLSALMQFLAERCQGEVRRFFESMRASMDELGEYEFAQIWAVSVRHTLVSLNADEMRELASLGQVLGSSEIDEQLTAIGRCQVFVDRALEQLRGEYPQLCRLAVALPAAAGLMLVIVLF